VANTGETREPPEQSSLARFIQELTGPWSWRGFMSLVWLVLLIFVLKGCVIDQYRIPTGSMEPTLHGDPRFFHGDRVLVNKWLYGPRIPFTTNRLWNWAAPERWDIVVFKPAPGHEDHPALIKRVAALPGEQVRIVEGQLEVDGERLPFPEHMPEDMHYYNDRDLQRLAAAAVTLRDRRIWEAMREQNPLIYGVLEEDAFTRVPPDHYFFLGDNSLHSVDGRAYGWVPRDHLLGRAFAIWWPWERRRDFTGFSQTWWGMLLLYGIPVAVIGYEVIQYRRHRHTGRQETAPVRESSSEVGTEAEDRDAAPKDSEEE